MSTFFVAATGTDVGKTFVTAGLIRHLRAHGRSLEVFKPIASGFDANNWAASDAGVLLNALEKDLTAENMDRMCPWRFTAPLSPDMAAARESRKIDFEAVVKACAAIPERGAQCSIIEAAGGVMTPIDGTHTMLDLAARLNWPVVLIAGSYLGTLSHTLTAREVLLARGLKIAAVVVSETPGSTVDLAETAAELARFAAPVPVIMLPRLPNQGAITALADLIGA